MSTKVIKLPHYCSPAEFDKYLDDILHTIYLLGKASTSKEIQQKNTSLGDFECLGRAGAFLNYLGLVEGKRSPFELNDNGRAIAIALTEGKGEQALKLWQQHLKEHSLYSELQNYMKIQGGATGSSLGFGEHLRKLADKKWGTNFVREGGKRLCILLSGKKLLEFDRDKDLISFPSAKPPPSPPPPKGLPATVTVPTTPQVPKTDFPTTLPYNINISIEAKDPDSIKQVINLIRELTGRKQESSS